MENKRADTREHTQDKKKTQKLFKPVQTSYNERVAMTVGVADWQTWSEAHMDCFYQEALE